MDLKILHGDLIDAPSPEELRVREHSYLICYEGNDQTLAFPEAFHLATAAGGRVFDRVGLLEPGYRFNALVLDNLEDEEFPLGPAARLERFCYCGDDRNITGRYLNGKPILL